MTRLALVGSWLALFGCGQRGGGEHEEHGGHEEGDEHEGHEEGEEHQSTVKLSPEAVRTAGIRVEPATKNALLAGVAVPAEIKLNPERTAHVRSPVEGPIAGVRVSLGDRVAEGDPLAEIRSVATGEARAALGEARARVEVARAAVARQEELMRAGVGAQRNLIDAQGELRTAQAALRGATERSRLYGGTGAGAVLKAPLAGEVLERHATVGEMVHTDDDLFLIGDLTSVWIVAHVYEQDVAVARTGIPARLTLDAYPGRQWEGTLAYVASRLDPETRTLEVRLELPNDGSLRPGLFGTLWLPPAGIDPTKTVLTVPESAIQRIEEGEVVFVEIAPNEYAAHTVQLGARGGGLFEVRSGIEEGARVVVAGAFVLKSELLKGEVGGHEH